MDEPSVLAYLSAVGDELPVYRESGLAPPLYGVALALGRILQRCNLPPGSIHSLQEFETLRPLSMGSEFSVQAWLDRQRQRGGLRFLTFGVNLEDEQQRAVLTIRTTLLVPEPRQDRQLPKKAVPREGKTVETAGSVKGVLGQVSRRITQSQLFEYSKVSGDKNPIHLDPEFAAGTQFGGIIAHGMLTLAFISEMMSAAMGEAWLSSGSMQARFKGATYPGDDLETWGKASSTDGDLLTYMVGLSKSATGEDLVTGTATVNKN